ncbi:MAG: hypothetical protein EB051_02410 [Chlamydiia bacterium]|nr:hypothetical protein [Chlamydiia bacterium]
MAAINASAERSVVGHALEYLDSAEGVGDVLKVGSYAAQWFETLAPSASCFEQVASFGKACGNSFQLVQVCSLPRSIADFVDPSSWAQASVYDVFKKTICLTANVSGTAAGFQTVGWLALGGAAPVIGAVAEVTGVISEVDGVLYPDASAEQAPPTPTRYGEVFQSYLKFFERVTGLALTLLGCIGFFCRHVLVPPLVNLVLGSICLVFKFIRYVHNEIFLKPQSGLSSP